MEPSLVSYFTCYQVLIMQIIRLNKQNLVDTYHSDEIVIAKVLVGLD